MIVLFFILFLLMYFLFFKIFKIDSKNKLDNQTRTQKETTGIRTRGQKHPPHHNE
jgi:hypothetical protein